MVDPAVSSKLSGATSGPSILRMAGCSLGADVVSATTGALGAGAAEMS